METIEGVVSHLQSTVKISGGGDNSRASTTYIALFRLDGRPVQFRCWKPIPFADGDRLKAAGRTRASDLFAYACRDLTTGAVLNSGVWSNVIMAVIMPVFGVFFCGFAGFILGKFAVLLYLGFLVGTGYLIYRAVQASTALRLVRQ